ncbi:arginyltransferase [Paraliomyxa miuraensis]|uniref:arginyltransferase n=1 Tax=Paraliomyxa miuraensis TaxID=376150 RepID=UPI00224D6EE3|nr:arginyltransferase [Paraliomyxa miuraensis]MCX4247236.1 arginyltransferase [Paraliomyxa miuraensis]
MSAPPQRRVIVASPPELVVHDAPSPCPYLPEETSRLPLRLPIRRLQRSELEQRLGAGDRRQGLMLYRTACPSCLACEPIRIDVQRFRPGRTQRRIERRGDREIEFEVGPLEPTLEKVALYNKHKRGRGLSSGERAIDLDGYTAFLGESCCDSFELRYRIGGRLIGVAVVDRAEDSLSAVYFYFDPEHESRSPGVYSVLKQLQLCRRWGLRHLYLGLYIARCASMAYKRRYLPHERLLDGRWVTFDRDQSP